MNDFKTSGGLDVLRELELVLHQRMSAKPDDSYVASLYAKGQIKILDKLGEEVAELMVAAACDKDERVVSEAADSYFHLLIFMVFAGIRLDALEGISVDALEGISADALEGISVDALDHKASIPNKYAKRDSSQEIQESFRQTTIVSLGQAFGGLIGEISLGAAPNKLDGEGVTKRVGELFSCIKLLHLSRGLDFALVAQELETRMRHK